MKKLLLLFAVLLSTVGVWAQTEVILVSENVESPEHVYYIMCNNSYNGNQYYMNMHSGPASSKENAHKFAFFAGTKEGDYQIYSVDLQKWLSYTPSAKDDTPAFAVLIDNQTDAQVWHASLAKSSTVYQFQPYNTQGSTYNSYMNWNGGVEPVANTHYKLDKEETVGVWRQGADNDGGSAWVITEALQEVSFTYNYTYKGTSKLTESVTARIGRAFPAPATLPAYVTYTLPEDNVAEEDGGTTIDVECNYNLPFEVSEDYATAKWYYMNIRSNDKKWVAHSVNLPYSNRKQRYPDIYGQWAFMGNPFDGIQLLNKGAGAGYTLGYDGTSTESNIHMKNGSTTWTIEQGNGGFALHIGTTNQYLHDYNQSLKIWNDGNAGGDRGSALQVEAVEEFKFHQLWGNHYPWTTEVLTELPDGVVDCSHHDDGLANIRMAQTNIVAKGGDITIDFAYSNGSHMLMIAGVDLVKDRVVVKQDYHEGSAGSNPSRTAYTLSEVETGEYTLRYFVCEKKSGTNQHSLDATYGNITVTGAKRANVGVKYVFTLDGVEKEQSELVSCVPGEEYPDIANVFPYGIYVTKPSGTIVDSDIVNGLVTKTIQMEERLPFYKSTSYEEATWYLLDMHSYEARYVWTYVPNATTAEYNVQLPVEGVQTELFGDDKLWCFVGNAYDGFKIYNKAAGENLTLNKPEDGNTSAWMSDAASATSYNLAPTTSVTKSSFCFQPKGHTFYLNTQGVLLTPQDKNKVKVLKGWDKTDEGSSCRFFTPTDFIKEAILANFDPVAPIGAVGTKTVLKDNTVRDIIANTLSAIQADGWNAEVITPEVSEAIGSLIESDKVEMAAGYYFIKGTGTGNSANWYVTYEGVDCKAVALANGEKLGAKHVWSIEAVDDEEGKYKFKSSNLDKYLTIVAAADVSKITSNYDDGHAFNFKETSSIAQWIIKDPNNYTMRTENDGRINEWHAGTDNGESWYIIPATELDITVTSAGWATTCLPFDVVLPEELTAYALTGVDNVNGEETGTVSLISKAGIPAKQGALLNGAPGTYTLSIEETASNWEANMLSGTTVAKDMSTLTGDVYLLTADGENSAKLSKLVLANDATEAKKTLAANKAYLNIATSSARFLVFNFDEDNETAIESIGSEEGNMKEEIFDLAGRRVQKAQKGLYIVNGQKVIK